MNLIAERNLHANRRFSFHDVACVHYGVIGGIFEEYLTALPLPEAPQLFSLDIDFSHSRNSNLSTLPVESGDDRPLSLELTGEV